MIETTIIILFSIAVLLFILSFFRKDRTYELEKQIEDLSIRHMQEIYQLKKKVQLLEEELLIQSPLSSFQAKPTAKQRLLAEIGNLYERGDDLQGIAKKTGLTYGEVEQLLKSYLGKEEIEE